MDLLTKYRPMKSLDFYQKKVLRFIHTSEGTDDLRSLAIPYGLLGFDSPLHFIRCIPQDLCDEYSNDKLFERRDKGIRKGYKVFLSHDDGRIQSAIYKGQKQTPNGEWGTVLDGHKNTYPTENIAPFKEFLRNNVGTMLAVGSNKVTGTIVNYEEPKWNVGDAIYYKPSKRWAVIEERELLKNGKVYCKIKLEKTKVKREKVVRVGLWELMSDAIPYRVPIIPKNDANIKVVEPKPKVKSPKIQQVSQPEVFDFNLPQNKNKLNKQLSQESEKSINSIKSPRTPMTPVTPVTPKAKTPKRIPSQSSSDNGNTSNANGIISLQNSPKSPRPRPHNDYTEAPTVAMRPKNRNPSMRPLTEYFHSKSEELHDDCQPFESSKFISVNNLASHQSEDEDFTFENYTHSLRRSARNILSKQLADEAYRRSVYSNAGSKASKSSDNLEARSPNQKPLNYAQQDYKSVQGLHIMQYPTTTATKQNFSTSEPSSSGAESPPPPLPPSQPPPNMSQLESDLFIQNPGYERSPSIVERYFIETVPKTYENSNYTRQQGSFSLSSDPSTSIHDGNYSLNDIPAALGHEPTTTQEQYELLKQHNDLFYSQNQNLQHSFSVPVFDQKSDFEEKRIDFQDYIEPFEPRPEDTNSSTVRKSRYVKNPSLSRSHKGEHFQKVRSIPDIMDPQIFQEPPVPQPFNGDNIHSAVGAGRGIQAGYHSCYADVSLFSIFYCCNIFDKLLLEETELDKGMKRDIKRILRLKIVKPLRISAFCSRESVSHLREAMLPLSSKLNSSFMDAEEFLYLLFENALNLPEFVKYSNGTNDFMHQIIVKPKDRLKCHDVQFLFRTSLEINDLKIKETPMPALMLCMPRCNGRLVYYEAIIPNLSLNITPLLDKGPKKCLCEMAATVECALCYKRYGDVSLAYCQTCQKMADQIHYHIGHNPVLIPKPQNNITLNLLAVICIRANHYTTFVKTSQDRFAPWLFFEASPTEYPEVILLDDLGRWLDKLEREPARYRDYAKMNPYLKRIITESHICIYFPPEAVPNPNKFAESFVI